MGFLGLRLPKKKDVTDFASRVYDQANPFDNGLSYQTRQVNPNQPQQNVVQQGGRAVTSLFPATSRFANTTRAGVGAVYGAGKLAGASLLGSDEDYNKTLIGVHNTLQSDLSRPGLITKQEAYNGMSPGDFSKRVGAGALGVGGEVAPIPAARAVQGGNILIRAGKVGGMSTLAGGAGSAGSQLIETGKVDPKQTLQAAAISGTLGFGLPIAGTAGKVISKPVTRGTNDLINFVRNSIDNPKKPGDLNLPTKTTISTQPSSPPTMSVAQLSSTAKNSFQNENTGVKPGGIDRAKGFIDNGTAQPIKVKRLENGDISIEDGRHRLEAARQMGLKDFPVEDVTQPTIKVQGEKTAGNYLDEAAQGLGLDTSANTPDMNLWNRTLNAASGGRVQNLMQINPIRRGAEKASEKFNAAATDLTQREGSIAQAPIRGARLISAQTGVEGKTKMLERVRADTQKSSGIIAKQAHSKAEDILSGADNPDMAKKNLDLFFREKDYIDANYPGSSKITYDQLSPQEKQVADLIRNLNIQRNEALYRQGRISKASYEAAKDGSHMPRLYDFTETKGKGGSQPFDTGSLKKRKDIANIEEDTLAASVKDPVQSSLIRWEIAMRDQASFDMLKQMKESGLLKDAAPNKYWSQLNGKKYGKFEGMYADDTTRSFIDNQFKYRSDAANNVSKLLESYKDSTFGKLDRMQKSFKTTLSPGTIIGNILSNPLFFNRGAGVGAIRQSIGATKAAARLAQEAGGKWDKGIYEARKYGVFGDNAGRQLIEGKQGVKIETFGDSRNPVTKTMDTAAAAYGGMDDAFKLALFENLRKKGVAPQKAAQEVAKFTQDYNNVGRLVGMLADAPILGKPFARFIPELIRLAKNNVVYNPAGTMAGLAAVAIMQNEFSKRAGETPEERQAREQQVGNTLIPGTAGLNKLVGGPNTDISLNFPIPNTDTAVNVARAVGLNFPLEPGADPNRALLEQLLPVEVPTRKDAQGNTVLDPTKIVTSMTFRPLVEQAFDRNFMGKSISDPSNKTYIEGVGEKGKKYAGEPSKQEQAQNRARQFGVSTLPFGNEADALISAVKGKPSVTGKERSIPEAVARTFGVKAEKNDQKAQQDRLDTKQYFEVDKKMVDDFLNKNPDLKDAYAKLKSNTRTRDTNTKTNDIIQPEKWAIIKGDKSNRLFDQLKAEAIAANKKDPKKPIDPIYQLNSPERVREVIELRSRPTGDDIEREEILRATTGWYKNFEKAERAYYDANSKYFEKLPKGDNPPNENPRAKEYRTIPHPEQSPLLQKYYQLRYGDQDKGIAGNEQAGKQFFKDNIDQLKQDTANYKSARLQEINAKRAIEGFSPISQDTFNNVTFGYEDDEKKVLRELQGKYGFGYGSGRGRKSDNIDVNNTKYMNSISVKKAPKTQTNARVGKVAVKQPAKNNKITVTRRKLRG